MSSLITVDCFVSELSAWAWLAAGCREECSASTQSRPQQYTGSTFSSAVNLNIRRKHSACISSSMKAAYILKEKEWVGLKRWSCVRMQALVCMHACAHMCAFGFASNMCIGIRAQLREGEICQLEFHQLNFGVWYVWVSEVNHIEGWLLSGRWHFEQHQGSWRELKRHVDCYFLSCT